MTNKKRTTSIIRWTARILGSLFAATGLIIFGSELVEHFSGEPVFSIDTTADFVALLLLHGSYIIGYIIAWKWEALGGVIAIGGVICSQIISPNPISMFAGQLIFIIPGILFLVYWYMIRQDKVFTETQ